MSIVEEVTAQMKAAMKAKDQSRLSTLRSMRAAFLNEMKRDGSDVVSDEVAEGLMRKLEKQRKESIEAFDKGGRPEMAENERAELAVIQEFLPQLADEAETRGWVEAAIASTGASEKKDMGKVMGALMKDHKAEVDGNIARKLVQELLG
ncbi:MAG: GatB/YqeY domain-containing protein [Myxococcota bacterium]|jgi:uncharacterized protein YqeY|nr:GatB/YqeY domain-containing protein [Myxococcota bacterium]